MLGTDLPGMRSALGALLAIQSAVAQQPTVVFVCEHGSVKSLVAIEHFAPLAGAAHLDLRAISRGTKPDSVVPAIVRSGLAADGFDVSAFRPRQFSPEDLTSAILVVALDADVDPVVRERVPVIRWDGLPAVTENYGRARAAIVSRVRALVDSLARNRATSRSPGPILRVVADVPLPGPAVRFDYQSLDTATNRLYIAHMNADQLVVVDLARRTVIANLDGFERVHGVIAVPELGRAYASVTGRQQVAVVDAKSLAVTARIGPIGYPNGLAFAPGVDRVFVSDNNGTDAVIDAGSDQLVTSIPLGAGAGNTVYDPVSKHILVAVHRLNELVAIDPVSATILSRASLPGVGNAHGVVLDPQRRLAFVAGTQNATVAVVELNTMRVTHTYPVAQDPDVLAFDPVWRRLYVSSESGGVTVLTEVDSAGGVGLRHNGDLMMPHAHTVSVDPRTHLVYFPLENVDGRPVLRIMAGDPPPAASR